MGKTNINNCAETMMSWESNWEDFKTNLPHKKDPYNKRNWGTTNHSICSFYGKLKPSISNILINTFTEEGGSILDPFCGSGTIPFEAAMNGRKSYSIDINPISIVLTNSKVKLTSYSKVMEIIADLANFISTFQVSEETFTRASEFGFNKKIVDYYHEQTFLDILGARQYFMQTENTAEIYLVKACLIHVLHGNRPYALSRNSHPITPYAPTGEFVYKNLIEKLTEKVVKVLMEKEKYTIKEGEVFHSDILKNWDPSIQDLDAIITSPPFFDSTKYYQTNWLRSWFLGWEYQDFEREKDLFVDTIQKRSMEVYDVVLAKCKERLKTNGVVVFHLGKSGKKDMGEEIKLYAKKYFTKIELFNEDVSTIEKHEINDKGSVSIHQYLVMV
jgi:DNA modification methylase